MGRETSEVYLEGNLFSTLAVYVRISVIKSRKGGEPWGMLVVVRNESVRKEAQ
jgi:hypothetical protein